MRVKGKFTGLVLSETCCRFAKKPFFCLLKFIWSSEYGCEERGISFWALRLRDRGVKVFIDYQSSSASVTLGRSCTEAESEYEHKGNKEDLRYGRGKSIRSLFKCQLPGRALLKSCKERLGLRHNAWVCKEGRKDCWASQVLRGMRAKGIY